MRHRTSAHKATSRDFPGCWWHRKPCRKAHKHPSTMVTHLASSTNSCSQSILRQIATLAHTLQHTSVDWAYHVQRSIKASLGSRNGTFWPRGRTLGGSGAINAMAYIRGNRRDYDRWQSVLGSDGTQWSWSKVLEHFRKSENMSDPELLVGDGTLYHGTGGYLNVEYIDNSDPLYGIIERASSELGYPWLDDFNRDRHIGYGRAHFTVIGATRCSPAKAFLTPVKDRSNLHVIKNALTTGITIDERSNVARGVRFVVGPHEQPLTVRARKEVILSAGAINTPQLLMLSGIGPKDELQSFGIRVRADLPVGGNLYDHVAIPVFYKFNGLNGTTSIEDEMFAQLDSLYEFTMRNRSQGVRFMHDLGVMAFYNTINATDPYPDVQVMNLGVPRGGGYGELLASNFEFSQPIADSIRKANREAILLYSHIILLQPKSRGRVRLASVDPRVHPLIDANYLAQEEDLRTLVRAVRIEQRLLETNAFRMAGAELLQLNIPGCAHFKYGSDAYWECYVRYMTVTTYHPVGTAKMGHGTDPDAVVDARLRVNGVQGLRVIDASIMPEIVSGNTNAPTMMIAEMGADFIKQEYA
ncbi:glucose dehydrogenase [FAD, quinone]-like [Anopheles albimanus]|uniref:glucose dehydrogenase [FAD, quinone]-like n=1 Tax=Anopheles albimanus TaxID=7167 RepID=UPI001640C0B7|nr:glucose dehydrogenase [FAD, quinone]-like [Anopheles albimanus]